MPNDKTQTTEKPKILKLSRRALKKIVGGRGNNEDQGTYIASRCPPKPKKGSEFV